MIYNFSNTYHTVWHFTAESILPIIDNLDNIKPGDTILLPDYPEYPIDLIKRILKGVKDIKTVHVPLARWPHLQGVIHYLRLTPEGKEKVRPLCDKLLTFIEKRDILHPAIMMHVRLCSRRWMPLTNLQDLIDILHKEYKIYIIFHLKYETGEVVVVKRDIKVPDIKNAEIIIDPTYEEQLILANSVDYAMSLGGGAGDVYQSITRIPSIGLMPPTNCGETLMNKENYPHSIVLTDNLPNVLNGVSTWDFDIEKVSVSDVLATFYNIVQQNIKYRPCPICGSKQVDILESLEFKLLQNVDLSPDYNLVACNRCDFIYADTKATQQQYDIFYKNHNIYESSVSVSDMEKYKITFKHLSKVIPKDKSILEIGFASGDLLKMFKNAGYSVCGLDTSKACVDSLNNNNIRAFQGSITNNTIVERFDYIILSHVMEHILDLDSAMKSLKNLLSDEGVLYLESPDAEQYINHGVTPFKYIDIEHINHFTTQSFANLVKNHGLNIIDSGNKLNPIGNDKFYPACWILASKLSMVKSSKCKKEIRAYIKKYVNKMYPEIKELIKTQQAIAVWGTGSFAQRLYMQGGLGKCNVSMYIDNNLSKRGKEFAGKRIIAPSDFKFHGSVLIASVYGTDDIIKQIKATGATNEIIVLSEEECK